MEFLSRITAVDLHACGEPGRVITGGVPDVPGNSMFEKRLYLEAHLDDLRLRMLREPRGYPASNCNLLLPPTVPGADAGFVIMEQVEYPPMSGTNTICVVTALIETGIVPASDGLRRLKLDTPAGLIEVEAEVRAGQVLSVTFTNVPCFAVHLDRPVEVPGLGTVTVDVAWGGMFYVIADANALGLEIVPGQARDLVRVGEMIKAAAREQLPVAHPQNSQVTGITIAQLSGPSGDPGVSRRNAVVVSTGELDWIVPPRGLARSTAPHAEPEPVPKWPASTPKVSLPSARTLSTRASSGLPLSDGLSQKPLSARTAPLCQRFAAEPGSPASPNTCSLRAILSREDSSFRISGATRVEDSDISARFRDSAGWPVIRQQKANFARTGGTTLSYRRAGPQK